MGFVEVIMGNRPWDDVMFVRVANRRAGLLWTLARGGFPLHNCVGTALGSHPHSGSALRPDSTSWWILESPYFQVSTYIILEPLVNPRVFRVFFAFQNIISQFSFTIRWFLDVSSSVAISDPISTFNIPDVNFKTVLQHFFMFYMHFNIKGESIKY